jgi:hypothetical protein
MNWFLSITLISLVAEAIDILTWSVPEQKKITRLSCVEFQHGSSPAQ